MILSMHPHAITARTVGSGLYMQDTWLVAADGGEPLADIPVRTFDASERS